MRQSRVRQLRVDIKPARKLDLLGRSWCLTGEDLGRFVRSNGIFVESLLAWKQEILNHMKKDLPLYYSKEQEYKEKIAELEEKLREAYIAMGAKPDMRFKKNKERALVDAEKNSASKKKKSSSKK